MFLSKTYSSKIYDFFISELNVPLDMKNDFIEYHTKLDSIEWRLYSKYGFGVKYRSDINEISIYKEEETAKINKIIKKVNLKLKIYSKSFKDDVYDILNKHLEISNITKEQFNIFDTYNWMIDLETKYKDVKLTFCINGFFALSAIPNDFLNTIEIENLFKELNDYLNK